MRGLRAELGSHATAELGAPAAAAVGATEGAAIEDAVLFAACATPPALRRTAIHDRVRKERSRAEKLTLGLLLLLRLDLQEVCTWLDDTLFPRGPLLATGVERFEHSLTVLCSQHPSPHPEPS